MAGCSKEGVEGNEESRFESEGVAGSGVGVLGLSCDALMLSCGRERQVDGTGSSCSQVEGDQEVDVRRPPNFLFQHRTARLASLLPCNQRPRTNVVAQPSFSRTKTQSTRPQEELSFHESLDRPSLVDVQLRWRVIDDGMGQYMIMLDLRRVKMQKRRTAERFTD